MILAFVALFKLGEAMGGIMTAPFYRSLGFHEITELAPGLAAIRDHERAVGMDDHGPRVAMRRPL